MTRSYFLQFYAYILFYRNKISLDASHHEDLCSLETELSHFWMGKLRQKRRIGTNSFNKNRSRTKQSRPLELPHISHSPPYLSAPKIRGFHRLQHREYCVSVSAVGQRIRAKEGGGVGINASLTSRCCFWANLLGEHFDFLISSFPCFALGVSFSSFAPLPYKCQASPYLGSERGSWTWRRMERFRSW